jgi:hypothetical protein
MLPQVAPVTFPDVDAAGFALLDAQTGSNVGSARTRSEVRDLISEIQEETPDLVGLVLVVAVDEKGQRIDSWPASSIVPG